MDPHSATVLGHQGQRHTTVRPELLTGRETQCPSSSEALARPCRWRLQSPSCRSPSSEGGAHPGV